MIKTYRTFFHIREHPRFEDLDVVKFHSVCQAEMATDSWRMACALVIVVLNFGDDEVAYLRKKAFPCDIYITCHLHSLLFVSHQESNNRILCINLPRKKQCRKILLLLLMDHEYTLMILSLSYIHRKD